MRGWFARRTLSSGTNAEAECAEFAKVGVDSLSKAK